MGTAGEGLAKEAVCLYNMGMKRFVFALCLLFLLAGCKQKAAEPFLQATALPVQTPAAVEERQAEVKASFAPTATPLFTSSPAPTLTPSPTPTPDPFAGVEKVVLEEDPRFYYAELTQALKERITGLSYPAEGESCRVSYEDLRYVGLIYVDYEGQERIGELMVHKKVAAEVMEIFYQLYTAAYPLASVRLVDDYGQPGQDTLSMEDNNTSSFCYRKVNDSKKLSWHNFGAAIDINPVENPYINGSHVSPEAGRAYLDRKDVRPHMITHGDYAYKVFHAHGWVWGGDFKGDKDYQHFYKDIGYKR